MAEEERTEETPEQGDEQAPEAGADEQAPEGQTPEEQASDEKAAEEQAVEDGGDQPAEEQGPGDSPEEESDQPSEPEGEGGEQPKAKDQPPGAELEPIAIESEREETAEERARREAEEEERARREAAAEEAPEEQAPREAAVKLEGDVRITATGKRKSSIARVIILPGDGKVTVNRLELDAYFPRSLHQSMARQPLVATGYDGNVDVRVNVHGGGISGQAGAVRHGIARALVEVDPELRGELKRRGYLTRDARRKERRKAGLKKARKRPQFSKR